MPTQEVPLPNGPWEEYIVCSFAADMTVAASLGRSCFNVLVLNAFF